MCPANKTVIESGLLYAQEINVQSRRLTSVKGKQVANGHIRREAMHFEERFVFQALDHDPVEHSMPAHSVYDFLSEARLIAAIVLQFNIQLDARLTLLPQSVQGRGDFLVKFRRRMPADRDGADFVVCQCPWNRLSRNFVTIQNDKTVRNGKSEATFMKSSTHDKAEGRAKEAVGKVKEETGKAIGNQDLEERGTAEKVGGKLERKVGDVKKVFEK